MVISKEDLKLRKDGILAVAVDYYIKTVSPVSSSYIAKTSKLDLSSATIRHILSELEEEGFLTHPHTSAGRMPTQKGYRYYVDNLMREIELLEAEKRRIKKEYEQTTSHLEDLLERTSLILSDTTQYTSIISVDGWDNRMFCRGMNYLVDCADNQDLKNISYILAALDEKARLLELINKNLEKKINIYIGHELAYSQMDGYSLVVSRYQTRQGPSGRIAVLGPTRMNYGRVVSAIDYFSEILEDIL